MDFEDTLRRAMDNKLQQYRHRLGIYLERYQGLSPLAKLNQGYSFVADTDGRGITSVFTGQARGTESKFL